MFTLLMILFALCYGIKYTSDNGIAAAIKCMEQTIANVFREDETLVFIDYSNKSDVFPVRTKNPYYVLNGTRLSELPNIHKYLPYHVNFIIHTNNYDDLWVNFRETTNRTLKDNYLATETKVIVMIQNEESVGRVYSKMVPHDRTVVITYSKEFAKLFTFEFKGCLNLTNLKYSILAQDCFSPTPITFNKVFRKYNGCPMVVAIRNGTYHTNPYHIASKIVLQTSKVIAEHFEMNYTYEGNQNPLYRYFVVTPKDSLNCYGNITCTKTIASTKFVFTVPLPKQISHMIVFTKIFKTEIWVLIILSFFLIIFVWWLTEKLMNTNRSVPIGSKFLYIFSITIFGSTTSIPVSTPLRCIFMGYIIYAIHIQTGFTAKFTELLTIPQYEATIKNNEELSNAELIVIVPEDFNYSIQCHRRRSEISDRILNKIKLIPNDNVYEYLNSSVTNKCSFYAPMDDILFAVVGSNNLTVHYIEDTSFVVNKKTTYFLKASDYSSFSLSFLKLVTTVIESGLINLIEQRHSEQLKEYKHRFNQMYLDDEPIPISTSHVFPIFVLWGIGITTSVLAFAGEHFVRYVKKKLQK